MDKPVLLHPLGLQGLHSLQALVPSLLRREVELALEKLDLIWDRTYAWDMFLDMMVRHRGQRSLNNFFSLLFYISSFSFLRMEHPALNMRGMQAPSLVAYKRDNLED